MQTNTLTAPDAQAALAPFAPFLNSQNEVLRSAAICALPTVLSQDIEGVRDALLTARLDPDPDVRSDAMEALVPLVRGGDTADILHSLKDDPVREVKLAAISALSHLCAPEAIPLLRSLVRSRSEDQVAWEDEGSDWEEWLDIQTAAIRALGEIGAEEAIDDMTAALMDEFGQSLDVPVFHALSQMGAVGVATLIEVFNLTTGASRRRAAAALARAAPEDFMLRLDEILAAPEAELRLLAIKAMAADDPGLQSLAQSDASALVRAAALRRASSAFLGLAQTCLGDPSDTVKAAALECLSFPLEPEFHEALVDNMLSWLPRCTPELAMGVIDRLVHLAPDRAVGPLVQILETGQSDLEVRVAASKALAAPELSVSTDLLAELLENPARQVRATLLTTLLVRSDSDEAALDLAAAFIAGAVAMPKRDPDESGLQSGPDAGTPKEGAGPRKIWITPEGDIMERDETPALEGQSTLDSILSDGNVIAPQSQAGETPEESGAKRARRRAVEGSDDLALSLAIDAMRVFRACDAPSLTEAMISRIEDPDDTVRRRAWEALSGRDLTPEITDKARAAFAGDDPLIRMSALRVLTRCPDSDILEPALKDEDALIRAEAALSLPPAKAVDYIKDNAVSVRQNVAQRILNCGKADLVEAAVVQVIMAERSDTLAVLARQSRSALQKALSMLAECGANHRRALVILRALASSQDLS
ncbi:MAG: HEAT repeat domain-containing protein [Paracoccaceae bacterium]|nr:HEAT repeat domain-containing protein [Paracoccaceae bacterium]